MKFATIDSKTWATTPRNDGHGNSPAGSPGRIDGTLTRPSEDVAIFESEQIPDRLTFKPTDEKGARLSLSTTCSENGPTGGAPSSAARARTAALVRFADGEQRSESRSRTVLDGRSWETGQPPQLSGGVLLDGGTVAQEDDLGL